MTVRVVTGSMMIVAITPHHKLYTQEEFKNALTPARYVSDFTGIPIWKFYKQHFCQSYL